MKEALEMKSGHLMNLTAQIVDIFAALQMIQPTIALENWQVSLQHNCLKTLAGLVNF